MPSYVANEVSEPAARRSDTIGNYALAKIKEAVLAVTDRDAQAHNRPVASPALAGGDAPLRMKTMRSRHDISAATRTRSDVRRGKDR